MADGLAWNRDSRKTRGLPNESFRSGGDVRRRFGWLEGTQRGSSFGSGVCELL